jgi:hypothetical protein
MRRGLVAAIAVAGWLSLAGIGAQASSPLGPPPVVQSIAPYVVAPGEVITISGQNLADALGCTSLLGGSPSVHFVGLDGSGEHVVQVASNPADCNNTTLPVAVPTGFAGGARVYAQDPRGQNSDSNLQVTLKPTGGVTPTSGTAGTQAAIVGTNLKPPTIAPNPVLQVFVGGVQQAPTAWSTGSIAFSPAGSGAVQVGFLVSTDTKDPAKQAAVSLNAGSYTYAPPPPPPPSGSGPGTGPGSSPAGPGGAGNPPASGTPGVVPGGPGPLPFGTFAGDFPNLIDPALGALSGALADPASLIDSNHQFHKPAKTPSPVQLSLVAEPHKTSAGGTADLTATLTLNGNPIAGAPVRLRMLLSPGSDFAFTPAAGVTDANGMFKSGVMISRVNGDSIVQAESGLYSDQDHIQGTGGEAPLSRVGRANTGGIVPLVALGLVGLALLVMGVWINLRFARSAAG